MTKIAHLGLGAGNLRTAKMLAMMDMMNPKGVNQHVIDLIPEDDATKKPKTYYTGEYKAANAGGKKGKERRLKQIARMPEHEKKRLGLI